MTKTTNFKKYWRDRISRFTDDYIDEWTADGDELDELHRIQDELIDEIHAYLARLIEEAKPNPLDKVWGESLKVAHDGGINDYEANLKSMLGQVE